MKKKYNVKKSIGIVAAIANITAVLFYERHLSRMMFDSNDVSHGIGLYVFLVSLALWITFIIMHLLSVAKSK